jgi:hypothetical protein
MRKLTAGLGWRPELAASIFANLDRIDVVEVIAEDWLDARERDLRALRLLGNTLPMILHGTSLGLASTHPVDARRLDKMARLIDAVRPVAWSEHLAFVRAGGMEIGHLAAPPRTRATIEGLTANVARARRITGHRAGAGEHCDADRSAAERDERERLRARGDRRVRRAAAARSAQPARKRDELPLERERVSRGDG